MSIVLRNDGASWEMGASGQALQSVKIYVDGKLSSGSTAIVHEFGAGEELELPVIGYVTPYVVSVGREPGTFEVRAVVNAYQNVPESNYGNNEKIITITVEPIEE